MLSSLHLSFVPNVSTCSKTPVLGIENIFCELQLIVNIAEEYGPLNIRK